MRREVRKSDKEMCTYVKKAAVWMQGHCVEAVIGDRKAVWEYCLRTTPLRVQTTRQVGTGTCNCRGRKAAIV